MVWEALRERGELLVDEPRAVDLHEWRDSYDWMANQMKARLGCDDSHYPWWAWQVPKPHMRKWRGFIRAENVENKRVVKIELSVLKSEVLLSLFIPWNMVLMHGYVASSREEDLVWEERLSGAGLGWNDYPLPEPWQTELVRSWERIFDLSCMASGGSWHTDQVQATFFRMAMKDVAKVTAY